MITIGRVPPPEEYRLQCRYSREVGKTPDRWTFCDSYVSAIDPNELTELLPYLREREKGMDFRVVKVTTSIEPTPDDHAPVNR